MKPDFTQFRERLGRLLAGFSSGQKAMLVLAAVAVVAGAYLFTSVASKPSYAALFSNLEAADASAITEELTGRGVAYELADGGATVMVPREQLYQLRLDMSAQGLPGQSSAGYALLDKQGITTSEFRQRVDYQRALEGELAKTVSAIEGVETAVVHLVIPEDDLFAGDEKHPSASILVDTGRRDTLAPGQVQAVVNLVSGSVEGLTPEAVTVADATGKVLSAPGVDGLDVAAGDARAQQAKAFEHDLSTSIEEMLVPVVGQGKAVVRVSADLDFDQRETTEERFGPAENVPAVTERTSREEYEGTGQAVGGVLGPDATAVEGGDGSTYSKESADRAFAVDKVTNQIKAAPGGVRRLSVAVLLDGNAPGAVAEADVTELVTAAAGLDAGRGDVVNVQTMAFDQTVAEEARAELEAARQAEQRGQMMDLARTLGVVLIVAVALFLAYRSARRSQVARYPLALPVEPEADEDPEDLTALEAPEAVALEAPPVTQIGISAEAQHRQQVEAQVGVLIDKQPDEVAQLLRGWLADRRS